MLILASGPVIILGESPLYVSIKCYVLLCPIENADIILSSVEETR